MFQLDFSFIPGRQVHQELRDSLYGVAGKELLQTLYDNKATDIKDLTKVPQSTSTSTKL
jgi:hypothetical protein